jgi:hypothetical protein
MTLPKAIHHLRMSAGLATALGALAALALVYFAWPAYRAFLPLQIDVNEAWNSYQADMLRAGRPLYSFDAFITNNYPPLSFYVVDTLSRAAGIDALYVGRLLSLAAAMATAFSIWACVRRLGASRLAAALGALWWFASMARWYAGYVGMDDPHLVALALMTWALAYALRDPKSRRVEIAIVLMALAGFYKHNLIAIPATTLCWWTLQDYRRGLRLALLGIAAVAVGFAICGLMFGQAFFHDLLLPRHYALARLGSIGRLQFIAPALIITAIWAAFRRHTAAARFVSIFLGLAFLSYAGQLLVDGVADNAMFELVVAAAIGIGCAFDDLAAIPAVRRWGLERSQAILVCILIARLLISARLSPYLVLTSPDFRSSLGDRVSVMQAESARISAIPGPVVCEDVPLACRFAGKPFVFDPFTVGQLIATGRISQAEVSHKIGDLKLRFETVDPRADISSLSHQ